MSSTVKKAKGFKKSRPGMYLAIGTSLFGAYNHIKRARNARGDDPLLLIDAVVSAAAIATGLAVLVRELRRMNDDDVLSS